MTVLPFTARPSRSLIGTAPPLAAPMAVTGSFRSPTGRGGTFTGSYRLEHCSSTLGQLTAAGVFTGELTDADGSPIGSRISGRYHPCYSVLTRDPCRRRPCRSYRSWSG